MASDSTTHFVKVGFTGRSKLLMHNPQMADPANQYVRLIRAITKKRNKTDADYEEIGRLEFMGSLYYAEPAGPYIPGDMVYAAIRNGGKTVRRGTDVARGIFVNEDYIKLNYDGPRNRDALFEDKRFVDFRRVTVNRGSSTMRTRPIFSDWSIDFTLEYSDDILSLDDLYQCVVLAGSRMGLGDFRPRFGRFDVTTWEPLN